jgi:chromosome segregation ATPase
MLRKIVIVGLAVGAGLFILHSTHLGSYARTAWSKARAAAKAQVPLEYQLETIRNEVADFMPEMRKQVSALAAEKMAVKRLRNDVTDLRASLTKQGSRIQAMKDDLQSGTVKTASFDRSGERLRAKLERELAAYKRCGDEIKAKESLLEAKEKNFALEAEKLASMQSQKEQWEVQIAQMETELKMLRLAQAKSSFQLDDSKFAHIKEMLKDVEHQIGLQQTENEMWGAFTSDTVSLEKKTKTDAQLIKEVEETLGQNSDLKVEATK